MADGEPQAWAKEGRRIGPRGERFYRRGLIAGFVAGPALGALYGLHRGGGEGLAVGAMLGLVGASLLIFPAIKLLLWLQAPRQPPLWPHERLYWSLTIALSLATLAGVTIGIGAFDPIEEHGADGFVDGFIAGLLAALLFAFMAARLHAWLMWLKGPEIPEAGGERSRLQSALAPTLAELEAVREDAGRHIRRRAAWMTPAAGLAGLALWVIYYLWTRELNLLAPPIAVLIGIAVGHVVAAHRLAAEYERLYKARVLPGLVARFGALSFQHPPPPPDLARLRQFHLFRHFDRARADDGIGGEYRGLMLSIVQLRLTRGVFGKRVFRGLLIEIELKNRLAGVTAVAADAGAFGNLLVELASRNIRRVGLESPAFEHAYEVYATDQVMARALLTPDFMERFAALGKSPGFGRPVALAQDNLLLLAMPRAEERSGADDYFAPPGYEQPASDQSVLERLHGDIKSVLRAADSVISLDAATSEAAARKSRPSGKRPQPTRP